MNLTNQITQTRTEMEHMAQTLGINHPDTIKKSQELDYLIYEDLLRRTNG